MSKIKQLVPEDVDEFDEIDFGQSEAEPNEIQFPKV